MKYIGVQMIDGNISSDWWKEVIKSFVKENAKMQIRCWNEESDEIKQALRYGVSHIEGYETCIDGLVCSDFLHELLHTAEPKDKTIYNKMTRYFTIMVTDGKRVFESSHYGTELYLVLSAEEISMFHEIIAPYKDSFSVAIGDI